MNKREKLELVASKPIYGGKTLSSYNDKTVILEKALPGERVLARIKKKKKDYIEAEAVEILTPSEHRAKADCAYFPHCGGCKLLDVDYAYQLQIKQEVVFDCVKRIAKVSDCEFLPVVGSELTKGYRNKMEFTFSNRTYHAQKVEVESEEDFSLGFHAPGCFKKVIDTERCFLQSENLNQVYSDLRTLLAESGEPAYDVLKQQGFFRHLVLRENQQGEVMVNLVTKRENSKLLKQIAEKIMAKHGCIKSFVNTINSGVAAVAFGEKIITIAGAEFLTDYIGEFHFEVSSNSFFQVNPKQTVKLYDLILDFAGLTGREHVLELYCGVGTISLYLSRAAASVDGFELVENAIINAKKNASQNGVTNCRFTTGDLMKLAREGRVFNGKDYDILVTDPPRDGMHPAVVKGIIDSGIKRVVYVSCNPSTFARDVEMMTNGGGYKLLKVVPVDMFPNTYHVETIGLLEKI